MLLPLRFALKRGGGENEGSDACHDNGRGAQIDCESEPRRKGSYMWTQAIRPERQKKSYRPHMGSAVLRLAGTSLKPIRTQTSERDDDPPRRLYLSQSLGRVEAGDRFGL
jgi:hypothetical protein